MVSVDVSELGSTEIHFNELGVKVNRAHYRINLLAQKLLQDIFWISHGGFFVFQHDGASSTRVYRRFPVRRVLDFIPPTLLPPNSTDLRSVDYL